MPLELPMIDVDYVPIPFQIADNVKQMLELGMLRGEIARALKVDNNHIERSTRIIQGLPYINPKYKKRVERTAAKKTAPADDGEAEE